MQIVIEHFSRMLLAAAWFACGGGIFALLIALIIRLYPEPTTDTLIHSVIFAALVTGVVGMMPGTCILNLRCVRSGLVAALLGICVAIVSFELSVLILLVLLYPVIWVNMLLAMIVGISIMWGWLAAFSGGIAGWLLFYVREPIISKLQLP
jgi:hypothetical protein